MTVYAIFLREEPVHDEAEMAEYQRKNRAGERDPNLKPLAIYGDFRTLEGPAPDGVLILEFPTMADAQSWYDSPAYQDAMAHRKRAADYRVIFVEGL